MLVGKETVVDERVAESGATESAIESATEAATESATESAIESAAEEECFSETEKRFPESEDRFPESEERFPESEVEDRRRSEEKDFLQERLLDSAEFSEAVEFDERTELQSAAFGALLRCTRTGADCGALGKATGVAWLWSLLRDVFREVLRLPVNLGLKLKRCPLRSNCDWKNLRGGMFFRFPLFFLEMAVLK